MDKEDVVLKSPRSGRLEGRQATPSEKRVCVGIITGAHGVRGALRIKSFTAEPEDVAKYGPLEDESGERRFELRLVGIAKGVLIARLPGVEDRDRAEALRGLRLYLPRTALPPPPEDEYYHADLIGLEAALADGTPVGRVRAVHDFGAGDTLEIDRSQGPPVMVPFTRAVVPVVDIDGGRLVLAPPEGLLDAPARAKQHRHPREGGGSGSDVTVGTALDSRFRGDDGEEGRSALPLADAAEPAS
jgi:16S rRNA processing protein RimM